jgi:hypothetical protein
MAEAHDEEEPKVDRPPNVEAEDFANYFSAYGYLYNQKVCCMAAIIAPIRIPPTLSVQLCAEKTVKL